MRLLVKRNEIELPDGSDLLEFYRQNEERLFGKQGKSPQNSKLDGPVPSLPPSSAMSQKNNPQSETGKPQYDPRVLDCAERYVANWEKRGEEALARVKAHLEEKARFEELAKQGNAQALYECLLKLDRENGELRVRLRELCEGAETLDKLVEARDAALAVLMPEQ